MPSSSILPPSVAVNWLPPIAVPLAIPVATCARYLEELLADSAETCLEISFSHDRVKAGGTIMLSSKTRTESTPQAVHSSRLGLGSILMTLLVVAVVIGSIIILVANFPSSSRNPTLLQTLAALTFVVVGLPMCIKILTSRITVTREGVVVRDLRRRLAYSWDEVYAVNVMPNFFWSYNVVLGVPGRKRGLFMLTSFLGNGHTVIKAILEAAKAANPDVKLVGWHHFGPPPYGIFTDKQTDA